MTYCSVNQSQFVHLFCYLKGKENFINWGIGACERKFAFLEKVHWGRGARGWYPSQACHSLNCHFTIHFWRHHLIVMLTKSCNGSCLIYKRWCKKILLPSTRVSEPQLCWHRGPCHSLLWGLSCAMSEQQLSTCRTPAAPPSLWQPKLLSWHCQMSPGW